jgi:hypothetical protein
VLDAEAPLDRGGDDLARAEVRGGRLEVGRGDGAREELRRLLVAQREALLADEEEALRLGLGQYGVGRVEAVGLDEAYGELARARLREEELDLAERIRRARRAVQRVLHDVGAVDGPQAQRRLLPRDRRVGGTDQLRPGRLRVRLIDRKRDDRPASHGRAHRRKQRCPRELLIELGRLRRRQRDLRPRDD